MCSLSVPKCPRAGAGGSAESTAAGAQGEDGCGGWVLALHNRLLSSHLSDTLMYLPSDHLKTEKELAKEKQILNEMLEVVEQRNDLVALLEEQRLQEKEEDKDLEAVMLSKGLGLNWV